MRWRIAQPNLRRARGVLAWFAVLAFLAWSIRLDVLEGYVYPLAAGFSGDFKSAASLDYWGGQGLFYGPLFVVETLLLFEPGRLPMVGVAQLDFVLFGLAFVCTWLAVSHCARAQWLVLALAGWLASHASVALFASAQHLEALELALLSVAALLVVRGKPGWAGMSIGLAIATKTLPVVFVPYLAVTRQWRTLALAVAAAAALLVVACWMQHISVWDGLLQLTLQGPNLTKTKATAEEYSLRAFFIRLQTGSGEVSPSLEQTQLAFGLHAGVSLAAVVWAAFVVRRTIASARAVVLTFGLIEASMLVVAPSSHIHYFVFLLPGWTAVLVELTQQPRGRASAALWAALIGSYVLVGFDQPIIAASRLLGIGQGLLTHWLDLNPLGLLLAVGALGACLLVFYARDAQVSGASADAASVNQDGTREERSVHGFALRVSKGR